MDNYRLLFTTTKAGDDGVVIWSVGDDAMAKTKTTTKVKSPLSSSLTKIAQKLCTKTRENGFN